MTIDSGPDSRVKTDHHRYLLLSASILTYLLITLGGTVCVTESGRSCPDWPGCYGQIIPPLQINAIIEYSHRFVAALTGLVVFAAAYAGWRKYRERRWVSSPPLIAIPFMLAVAVFGAFAVLTGLPRGWAAVDLSSALAVQALLLAATAAAFVFHTHPELPDRVVLRTPFARLTAWALGAVYVVLVSGVLVAESGSLVRCLGWPMYSPGLTSGHPLATLQMGRGLFAVLAGLLVLSVVIQAWRTQRQRKDLTTLATLCGVLLLVEAGIGIILAGRGFSQPLLVAYVAIAAAIWALLVALLVLAGLMPSEDARERAPVARRVEGAL